MRSRWSETGEHEAIRRWAEVGGEDLARRLHSARLIGEEPDLVLHGGGNVSLKSSRRTILGEEVETLRIKGSGADLANLEPAGFPELDLAYLRRLRVLDVLDDRSMANELQRHLFDVNAPAPSVETLVHAFLPHRFVDHSHADAVLAITNQEEGARLVGEALGERVALVPYVYPGFDLAKAVVEAYETHPEVEGIVLLHHGLITFADDARSSYERHIAIVDECERFLAARCRRRLTVAVSFTKEPRELAALVAPLLRGRLAIPTGNPDSPYRTSVLEWRATPALLEFVNSAEARELVRTGPLTTDHLIRTGPEPLFVSKPRWDDEAALAAQLQDAIEAYRDGYRAYLREQGAAHTLTDVQRRAVEEADPSPRVVLLPGAGAFCWGVTKRDAVIAADITEHTIASQVKAHGVGRYQGLERSHLFRMEFRPQQLAKLGSARDAPLARRIVVVSGGAGAIGVAIAEVCALAGAQVVITDIHEERLQVVVRRIEEKCARGCVVPLRMDVTDERSVREGFEEVCRLCGGADVIVPNAGIAHVAPLTDLELADFKRVLDVNLVGSLLLMREGARLLQRQGIGGHIIVNSSKNVFGPGKDFGAYSASKAGGHQLGKIAAIELAPFGIRVNMLNVDAVFGDAEIPSGLWAEVGPGRARSRGLTEAELPEYYRQRNLLKARVFGHHVGNAVVFFASNATPTTGATLPIDGGVVEAFPR
ncbi:MAG: bifunctional aldolase/short-chain dehydrogenase [Planctomycetota bacterium]